MDETLTRIVSRDVRPALKLIYGLRECGVEEDIDIPQVAVIGDQSSGKSSVLESICSLPLPRGAGLVTRCAIELRLSDSNIPSNGSSGKEKEWHATISTSRKPEPVPVQSVEELEISIAEHAEDLIDLRRNGGFSRERIIVEITSPGAPNLTLIDLPGIIRTQTSGDFFPIPFFDSQDRGAIREVSELIQSYVKQERTILLVVVPCTQDVATIEALEWASKADETGKRTIGVLTKPDLIDDGAESEVAAVLMNKRKPLSLGYVMLKNRSQREILDNLSVSEARESERSYFEEHSTWSNMNTNLFGIENLIAKITKLYVSRIYDALPSMRQEITANLDRSKEELKEIGVGAGETPAEASMTLMRLVFEYNNLLSDAAAGRYVKKELWDENFRLCTKVRELYDEFKKEIAKTRPKFENDKEFVKEIAQEIRNSRGRELPGFLNPRIFESRVAQYVETWREASKNLLSSVQYLVRKTSQDLFSSICPDFPGLRQRMNLVIANSVQELERKARKDVQGVFSREIGQPFTLNEQFLASVNKKRLERFDAAVMVALSRSGTDNRGKPKDRDVSKLLRAWYESYHCSGTSQRVHAEAEDMSTMLGCYWNVSADRFVDNLVMALENSFIKPLAQSIHVPMNDIVLRVGKSSEELNSLLREDTLLVKRRKNLIESKDRLKKALSLIENFEY